MSGGNVINSVLKTLNLVELLDACGEMGVTEIARKMGFEKSMVSRMLNTLKAKKYVRQNPDTLKYSNSYKFYELGQNVIRNPGLPKMALRFMNELAALVPEGSVNLAVREGYEAVYIEKIESAATISVSMKIGQTLPLHCSAAGKALLMFQAEDKLRHISGLLQFDKFTPNTIGGFIELRKELEESKKRGYALDDEEHLAGIRCAAAPVFDSRGQTIAAISVSCPAMPSGNCRDLDEIGRAAQKTALEFTDFLGGEPARKT